MKARILMMDSDLVLYNFNEGDLTLELFQGKGRDIPIKDFFQYGVVIKDSKVEEKLK